MVFLWLFYVLYGSCTFLLSHCNPNQSLNMHDSWNICYINIWTFTLLFFFFLHTCMVVFLVFHQSPRVEQRRNDTKEGAVSAVLFACQNDEFLIGFSHRAHARTAWTTAKNATVVQLKTNEHEIKKHVYGDDLSSDFSILLHIGGVVFLIFLTTCYRQLRERTGPCWEE